MLLRHLESKRYKLDKEEIEKQLKDREAARENNGAAGSGQAGPNNNGGEGKNAAGLQPDLRADVLHDAASDAGLFFPLLSPPLTL